jgi:guanidinopropionase
VAGVAPLSIGGDHLVSLPILRTLAKTYGPVGMVHFDAHTDSKASA